MNLKTIPALGLSVVVMTWGLLTAPNANAGCDPALAQRAMQYQQQQLQAQAQHIEAVYGGHLKQPQWLSQSDGLLTACTANNWPKINVSSPLLSKLLSGALEKAAKAACDKARQQISQAASSYESVINTIPGYENVIDSAAGSLGNWPTIPNVGDVLPTIPNLPSGSGFTWNDLNKVLPPGQTIPQIPGITPGTPAPPTNGGLPGITP